MPPALTGYQGKELTAYCVQSRIGKLDFKAQRPFRYRLQTFTALPFGRPAGVIAAEWGAIAERKSLKRFAGRIGQLRPDFAAVALNVQGKVPSPDIQCPGSDRARTASAFKENETILPEAVGEDRS